MRGRKGGWLFASLKWASVKNPEQISRARRELAIVNCQRLTEVGNQLDDKVAKGMKREMEKELRRERIDGE